MVGGVDVAVWSATNGTLVMATNTYYVSQSVEWASVSVDGDGATSIFSSGSAMTSSGFALPSMGSAAFLLQSSLNPQNGSSSSGGPRTLVNGGMMMGVTLASLLLVS